jgi:hypothetical protein
LSDVVLGARPWNGKEWLGFNEKEVRLSIDFPEKQMVNGINFSFLSAESSWIHIPEKVIFEYSKNGKRWKSKEFQVQKEFNRFVIHKKVKFVRITVVGKKEIEDGLPGSGHTPWLFMDEIYFD